MRNIEMAKMVTVVQDHIKIEIVSVMRKEKQLGIVVQERIKPEHSEISDLSEDINDDYCYFHVYYYYCVTYARKIKSNNIGRKNINYNNYP